MIVTHNSLSEAICELEKTRSALSLAPAEAKTAAELVEWMWQRQHFDESAQAAAFGQAAAFTALLAHRGELHFGELWRNVSVDAQKFMLALRDIGEKARLPESVSSALSQSVSQYAFFKTVQRKMSLLFTKLNFAPPFDSQGSRASLQGLVWLLFLNSRVVVLRGTELISEAIAMMVAVVAAVLQEGVTYSQTLALEGEENGDDGALAELGKIVGVRGVSDLRKAASAFNRFKNGLVREGLLPETCSAPETLAKCLASLEEDVKARMQPAEFELAQLALGFKKRQKDDSMSKFASPLHSAHTLNSEQFSSWKLDDKVLGRCHSPLPSTSSLEAGEIPTAAVHQGAIDDLRRFLTSSCHEGLKISKSLLRKKFGGLEGERFFEKELPCKANKIVEFLSKESLPFLATRDHLSSLTILFINNVRIEHFEATVSDFLSVALCFCAELIFHAWSLHSLLGNSFIALDYPLEKALRIHVAGLTWEKLLPPSLLHHGHRIDRHLADFSLFMHRQHQVPLSKKDPLWPLCNDHSLSTITAICAQLQIGRSAQASAQRLFEALLSSHPALFAGRAMSQVVLCSLYAVCKLGEVGVKFAEILAAFSRIHFCHTPCAYAASHQPEHVIKFYNREFLRAMADTSTREKTFRAAFESPTQKTEVKPRTSELGGRSSAGNSAPQTQGECSTRVLQFRAD